MIALSLTCLYSLSYSLEKATTPPQGSFTKRAFSFLSMSSTSLFMAGSHGNNGWIPYNIGVMIIDEDPLSLLFVHTMLETCHYRVVSFSNPVDALHEICKKRAEFDLVIVDLHMVTMPGFSLVERIAKGLKLPVITTCADEESDLLHQALNCGACFHLVKPITVNNMEFVWKKSWRNRVNGPLEPLRLMKFHNEGDGIVSHGKRPLQIGSSSSFKFARYKTNYTRKKGYLRERDEDSDSEDHSRPRLQWDYELHKRFLVAVSMLGTAHKLMLLGKVNLDVHHQISSYNIYGQICWTSSDTNYACAISGLTYREHTLGKNMMASLLDWETDLPVSMSIYAHEDQCLRSFLDLIKLDKWLRKGVNLNLQESDQLVGSIIYLNPTKTEYCYARRVGLNLASVQLVDAVPSSIIGIMNVAGLTTKQVASHLQKHRKRLLKEKQTKDREKYLTNLVTVQKFPTCLASSSSQKPNNQSLLINNQMNQEVMQHQSSNSVVRRTPFILPKPPSTTNNSSERSTILQQHSSSFQNTPLIYPSTNQWFDIPNDTIGNTSAERSTSLQNRTSQVHGFTQSCQTSTPSILHESFTDLMNCNSYINISQFMNFDFTPIESNINMGTTENYDVAFPSNSDDPLQTGSSLYGNLHPTAHNVNVMKEPVIPDAANEWPSVDEFLGLNNELQFASQTDFVVPGADSSTNFNFDFDFGYDFNNFRDLTFDYAFLAEMLNDIDKGGAA